jgi:hypothetical protein
VPIWIPNYMEAEENGKSRSERRCGRWRNLPTQFNDSARSEDALPQLGEGASRALPHRQ